jgi:hypothetical protein
MHGATIKINVHVFPVASGRGSTVNFNFGFFVNTFFLEKQLMKTKEIVISADW